MIIRILIFILLSACGLSAQENNAQQVFLQANKAYENSDYAGAVSLYESLVSSNIADTALFYNLGNACYRMNKPGRAVLYYERALKISPRDEDTEFNLKFVRAIIRDQEEGILYRIADFFTTNELTLFCSLMYFLFTAGIILSFFFTHPAIKRVNYTLGTVLFIGIFLWYARFSTIDKKVSGIVITAPAEVRSGPGGDYSVGFTLPEGKKVTILSEKDSWYAVAVKQYEPQKIVLKGWIPKELVEKI